MGVPAFFRWLINSAPQVLKHADYTNPSKNPQIDNLYLDMNGIIHPCSHPQGESEIRIPQNESEMFQNIKTYLDLILKLTKPKKLIYFAIDGVAPKAKMNQQRGRRFRSAQEIQQKQKKTNTILSDLKKKGYKLSPELEKKSQWDHNVITPGTVFMEKVSDFLKSYIIENLGNNEGWKNLNIVFSDSNEPKEGEHKILEFIRNQRLEKDYDCNLRHCIYGADADLIMLGLSTHEPHFFVIRERLDQNERGKYGRKGRKVMERKKDFNVLFTFVKIFVVREFLGEFMKGVSLIFKFDLENVIDDFVFLCFMVGNDFLPNIPGFNIRNGGIDLLLNFYRKNLNHLGGYLTHRCTLNLRSLEKFFYELSKAEYPLLKTIEDSQFYYNSMSKKRDKDELKRHNYTDNTLKKTVKTLRPPRKPSNPKAQNPFNPAPIRNGANNPNPNKALPQRKAATTNPINARIRNPLRLRNKLQTTLLQIKIPNNKKRLQILPKHNKNILHTRPNLELQLLL